MDLKDHKAAAIEYKYVIWINDTKYKTVFLCQVANLILHADGRVILH